MSGKALAAGFAANQTDQEPAASALPLTYLLEVCFMRTDSSLNELLANAPRFAERFYALLLERCPEFRPLFRESQMGFPGTMLTMALQVLIHYHDRPTPAAEQYLRFLGNRHHGLGLVTEDYTRFREVLIETLAQFLGPQWTETLAANWRDALDKGIGIMLQESPGQRVIGAEARTAEGPPASEVAFVAEVVQRLHARLEEYDHLFDVTHKVNQGLALDDVLDGVYDAFRGVIPYNRIGFALIDERLGSVTARWAKSDRAVRLGRNYGEALSGSTLQQLMDTGEPRIINDLQEYLARKPQSLSTRLVVEEGMRSSLTCPLINLGRPVGFMFFSSTDAGAYANAHVEMFQHLAGQLAVIVEKSRLYSQLQEQALVIKKQNRLLGNANEELERRVQERTAELAAASDAIRTNLRTQEVTNAILRLAMESASPREFLAKTLDLIVSIPWLAFESKGCIFLADEQRQALEMVVQRDYPPDLAEACRTLPVGQCLCGRAAATREIVFAGSADERHEKRYPGMHPHAHYCVPILSEDRLLGVLNLGVPADHHPTSEERTLLSSLANIVAMTLQRKEAEQDSRKKEAQLIAAGEIQKFLLPKESVRMPGFSIEGRCYPAEFAAGDHFDYVPLPDGSLLVVLGDVSGHGVGPAIITAAFHAQFQALAQQSFDLPEMAAKVNASLHEATGAEIFITLIAARIDPVSRTLTFLNAGHPAGIVLDSSGAVKASLESRNLPLAILPDVAFELGDPIELAAGDIVFFYTDGLVEAQSRDRPMFGLARALQIVRENMDRSPAEIIEALYNAVRRYLGTEKPHDDITVVVMKVKPHGETRPDKP